MCAADAIGRVSDDLGRVRDAVMRRCHGEPVTVHETHISWVLVAGDRAFKLKKPVVLDFLDCARLARFHAECPVSRVQHGSHTVRHEVQENLSELGDVCTDPATAARTAVWGRFLEAWMAARQELLDARGRDGNIREVHGDLRAEHVIVAPRLSVVDCVEFDTGLRTLDVADDLAFLVMDLCARGAEERAQELVAAYRDSHGDCGPDQLLWFFAVHRALIRAKVALVRAGQTGDVDDDAVALLLTVADRCAWRARGAPAVAVCEWAQSAPLVFVQCVAPADVLRRRAVAREDDLGRISDAGVDVVERERDRFEPLDEAVADRHLVLRTDRDTSAVVADLLALLDVRLRVMTSANGAA